MSCAHEGRIDTVPVVVEPVVVPVPAIAVPVQIANVEVAVGVAKLYRKPPKPPPLVYH